MSESDSMVERVARAIDPDAWHEEPGAGFSGMQPKGQARETTVRKWWQAFSNRRNTARRHARIAIAAMREPTAGMLAACNGADRLSTAAMIDADTHAMWQAGIDAALQEDKP